MSAATPIFIAPSVLQGGFGRRLRSDRPELTPSSVALVDHYCPLPECDCRCAHLVIRTSDQPDGILATLLYEFPRPDHERLSLALGFRQGPDPIPWLHLVERVALATRAQRFEYESRYLDLRATFLDPRAPFHAMLRFSANHPRLPIPKPIVVREGRRIVSRREDVRDLAADAEPLFAQRNLADLLSPPDLLCLVMIVDRAKTHTGESAAAALAARGIYVANARKLSQRIENSSRDSGRFARPEERVFQRLPDALLAGYLDAMRARPELKPPPAPRAPEAPPKRVEEPPKAKPAAVPPEAPTAPAVPPAPAFAPAPRTHAPLDEAALAKVLEAPARAPVFARLALDAQRLTSAAQFDELLAVGSLRDVIPHRYQVETVRRVLRALRGRGILADEVGLGKTVEAIMVLREYQVRGMVRRALVLCPPSLVGQWAGELSQKAGVTARTTEDPRLREDPEGFWREPGVVIASLALARGAKHGPLARETPWDLVIVDEAHHIKNRTTLAYKLVSELKRRFLLLVTATPVENDLEEIYNLVTLLRPGQFETPAAFRKRFVDPKDPTRPRDRDALRALLGEVMVRNTRAQSGIALPPRFVRTLAVDPSDEEKALYQSVLGFVRAHHEDPSLALAATALLLEAGSSPRAVRHTLDRMIERRTGRGEKALRDALQGLATQAAKVPGTRKVDALLGVVAAQREPALVFTRFRETLDEVVQAVSRAGVAAVPFHGGLDAGARAAALARFREGGAVVMVATATGSEGHNLQHCNVLVNFDLPWNPMAIEQRIGRLHRMGQTREVHVYNLCAKGTIEERVLDVLDRRVQLFQLVVGEMDMVLGNIADERDLEEWIASSVARSRSDADVDATFDRLAADLLAARGRYEKTRALDEALFGKDFEA